MRMLTLQISSAQPYRHALRYNASSTILGCCDSKHFVLMNLHVIILFIPADRTLMRLAQISFTVNSAEFIISPSFSYSKCYQHVLLPWKSWVRTIFVRPRSSRQWFQILSRKTGAYTVELSILDSDWKMVTYSSSSVALSWLRQTFSLDSFITILLGKLNVLNSLFINERMNFGIEKMLELWFWRWQIVYLDSMYHLIRNQDKVERRPMLALVFYHDVNKVAMEVS